MARRRTREEENDRVLDGLRQLHPWIFDCVDYDKLREELKSIPDRRGRPQKDPENNRTICVFLAFMEEVLGFPPEKTLKEMLTWKSRDYASVLSYYKAHSVAFRTRVADKAMRLNGNGKILTIMPNGGRVLTQMPNDGEAFPARPLIAVTDLTLDFRTWDVKGEVIDRLSRSRSQKRRRIL